MNPAEQTRAPMRRSWSETKNALRDRKKKLDRNHGEIDQNTTLSTNCHEQENGRTEMDSQGRISEGEEGRTEEQRKQRNEKKSCFDGYLCRCLASSYKVYLTTLLRHNWAYNLGAHGPIQSHNPYYGIRISHSTALQPAASSGSAWS